MGTRNRTKDQNLRVFCWLNFDPHPYGGNKKGPKMSMGNFSHVVKVIFLVVSLVVTPCKGLLFNRPLCPFFCRTPKMMVFLLVSR